MGLKKIKYKNIFARTKEICLICKQTKLYHFGHFPNIINVQYWQYLCILSPVSSSLSGTGNILWFTHHEIILFTTNCNELCPVAPEKQLFDAWEHNIWWKTLIVQKFWIVLSENQKKSIQNPSSITHLLLIHIISADVQWTRPFVCVPQVKTGTSVLL